MYECIVNPSSHSGKGDRLWGELKSEFEKKGLEYREHITDGPGAAKRASDEITAAYSPEGGRKQKIVILGGDGTLNEVVSGINDLSGVQIGYIPTGSSNDFARGVCLPKDPQKLIETIIRGETVRRLDVGELTYNSQTKTLSRLHDDTISSVRRFVVSAGIGFDAAVCEEALSSGTKNFLNKLGLGKLTYGSIALKQLMNADKIAVEIETVEGEKIKLDHFLFTAAMIQPYEGGGFKFAPDADDSDGLFNICMVGDMTKPEMLRALPKAYFGKHYGLSGLYHFKTAQIRIKTQLPMWVHTDGEVMMKSDDITIRCLKGVLDMMV